MERKAIDTAYVVIGKFNGATMIWRNGVYDSAAEAEENWFSVWHNSDEDVEFVGTLRVVLPA